MNKSIHNGRIIKFLLLLEEFDVQIVEKPSKHNVVADFLSRVPHQIKEGFVNDYFPYEQLFAITNQTLWFNDIAN